MGCENVAIVGRTRGINKKPQIFRFKAFEKVAGTGLEPMTFGL